MSKSTRIATSATMILSALAFFSASATSLAAIHAVDEPATSTLPTDPAPQAAVADPSSKEEAPAPSTPAQAQAPAPIEPRSLAALVAARADEAELDEEARCLATAIYHESRSESLDGQLAVARVVINRARSGRFPTSLCGVVTQPGQFSFVRAGRLPNVNNGSGQWRNAAAIARIALDDAWDSHVEGALFFHAARVTPGWNRERLAQVGNHVFYR